jgi:hypothetical protein
MKFLEIFKEIEGVFKLPTKRYYFGKSSFGTPYFDPMNYVGSIIRVRKLKPRTSEEIEKKNEQYEHNKNKPDHLYSNFPMVRRAKNKIVKVFRKDYYITWGWPVSIKTTQLGWKDKFESPRFEWPPQFTILFFGLQFCIWWNAPKLEGEEYSNNDKYYEMILHYLKYTVNKDIKEAEETWGWIDSDTKKSTWNENYLK